MATTTLPSAATQDPFQWITIKNYYTEELIVSPQVGESIEGTVDQTITIRPLCVASFQSDGATSWWVVSTGKPNAVVDLNNMTGGPHLVPLQPTWFTLPGTDFTTAYEGLFLYGGVIEFDVTAVPGNQAWDVDLQLWNNTDSVVVANLDYGGVGNPTTPVRDSWMTPAVGLKVSKTYLLRVSRTSSTGDIYVDLCETDLTGPM